MIIVAEDVDNEATVEVLECEGRGVEEAHPGVVTHHLGKRPPTVLEGLLDQMPTDWQGRIT